LWVEKPRKANAIPKHKPIYYLINYFSVNHFHQKGVKIFIAVKSFDVLAVVKIMDLVS